jgi:4-hydroxy-tetrahydrodipicolinate synthase
VDAISRHPLCAGVKDSSGNWDYFHALVARFRSRPDFTVLMGLEEYIESGVEAGAHGAVSGGANLCPELYVSCYRAAVEGRTEEARALQNRINAIVTGIYGMTPGIGGYLRGLKCAMELRGLCSGAMSDSFEPYAGAERYRVGEVLARLGLL